MSRCGLAVRRYTGKQNELGSVRFGSPFSSEMVVYGQTLSRDLVHTIHETFKCLTQLPALIAESFSVVTVQRVGDRT